MNPKLSFYTVVSPTFYDGDDGYLKNIIYSTRTTEMLSLHHDYLLALEQDLWEALPTDVVEKLVASKIVVDQEEDELAEILQYNRSVLDADNTLSFVVQPTAQCQLGCDYCGQEHKNKKLTDDLSEKILDRFKSLLDKQSFSKVYVSWFGAEPLIALSRIKKMSKQFIDYAQKKGCNYGSKVVTNGLNLSLEKFKTLVEDCGVEFIEITLDGIAEFHDSRRFSKKGLPTFDKIFFNLLQIVHSEYYRQINFKISIRCNVDERNYAGVSPLIDMLALNDLQDKISFYVAPVHSWGNDAHKLSLEKHEFADREMEWIIQLQEKGFYQGYLPKKKPVVCMAVKDNAELIDTYGNVYNCTEISYVPYYDDQDFVIENLLSDSQQKNNRKYSDFYERIGQQELPCSTCNMLPVCGGGCPKSWEEGNIACPSNKFNIEQKLLLYYAELKGGLNSAVNN